MAVFDLKGAMENLGIDAGGFGQIRLGRGVIGKTGYVAGAALLVCLVVAVKLNGTIPLLALVGVVFLIFLFYLLGSYFFAQKNPALALLEGAEIIAYKKFEVEAKGLPAGTSTILIEDQNSDILLAPPESGD